MARDLSGVDYVYLWVDGTHLGIRLDEDKLCLLVMIGVRADGRKELVALADGYRESAESWADLLRDCARRGMRAPVLAIGDGALGFWKAAREVFPQARTQRCHPGRDRPGGARRNRRAARRAPVRVPRPARRLRPAGALLLVGNGTQSTAASASPPAPMSAPPRSSVCMSGPLGGATGLGTPRETCRWMEALWCKAHCGVAQQSVRGDRRSQSRPRLSSVLSCAPSRWSTPG
jgi:hypothetical protein